MMPEQAGYARALLAQPDATIASIARLPGVSRSTICKYIPELRADGEVQVLPTLKVSMTASLIMSILIRVPRTLECGMLAVSPGCSRRRCCSRWRASCGKPGCLDRLRRA